jgi:inositol phosphorylceramide mannosyltransferase catalytic subunit
MPDIIPKIIHQTYATPELHPALRANVERLKGDNPDWEYRFYDDAAIVKFIDREYGADVLSLWQSISPRYGAARADFFRYLLMYRVGGVYLDIKSKVEGSLSRFIRDDDQYVIGQWRNGANESHAGWALWPKLAHVPGGEFQQWYMMSVPAHPFLKAVIDAVSAKISNYDARRDGVGQIGVVNTTGPIIYTKAIWPMLGEHSHRIARNTDVGPQYNVFPGRLHTVVLKSHYEKNVSPIVRRGGWAGVSNRAYASYRLVKRVSRHLRDFLRDSTLRRVTRQSEDARN